MVGDGDGSEGLVDPIGIPCRRTLNYQVHHIEGKGLCKEVLIMGTIEEVIAEVVDSLKQEKGPTFGGVRRNRGVSADVSWPTSWIEVEDVIDQWRGSKGFKGQGSIGFGR